MESTKIAPHESFQIHELLMFKNLCATKSAMMLNVVEDEELRTLLKTDINMSKQQIAELKNLLEANQYYETNITH